MKYDSKNLSNYGKGFSQHGVSISSENDSQYIGNCPFCHTIDHFYIGKETGLWDCKRCGDSGNYNQFLEARHMEYRKRLDSQAVRRLAAHRGLKPQTISAWGVGYSGDFYAIPVNGGLSRKLTDIKRYYLGHSSLSTSACVHSFMSHQTKFDSSRVWLCEGEWDGMALFEILRGNKIREDVYAVSGAGSLTSKTVSEFLGKDEIVIMFDNDDAGKEGARKAFDLLGSVVRNVICLVWEDWVPFGFDIRDLYHKNSKDAVKSWRMISRLLSSKPPEIEEGESNKHLPRVTASLSSIQLDGERQDSKDVMRKFRKWLIISDAECLDVMFGSVIANRLQGDPLWMFFVAPPGGMKSELLMSMDRAPLIYTTSTLTSASLVSGLNIAGGGDPSLIPKLNNKVLVFKDFTTIVNMPIIQRDEIFGLFRDAYDGKIEKQFGNGVVRSYKSKFGVIAGVTSVIEKMNKLSTALGERFLKYRIRQSFSSGIEKQVIRKAILNVSQNDEMRSQLMEVSHDILSFDYVKEYKRMGLPNSVPKLSDEIVKRLIDLSRWIGRLRGAVSRDRYSGVVEFKPSSEVGTRLGKQLCKLAYGISMYKGDSEVSESTYRTIVNVAQDTVPDMVEEIVKQLFIRDQRSKKSRTVKEISEWTKFPGDTVRRLLDDLLLLEVIKRDSGDRNRWVLNSSFSFLMRKLDLYIKEREWLNVKENRTK